MQFYNIVINFLTELIEITTATVYMLRHTLQDRSKPCRLVASIA